jgi:SAM-dependent methyltransferase
MTNLDSRNSVILDIGCGSGYKVKELHEAGFLAFGVDKSKAMIERGNAKYPTIHIKQGDIYEPMLYESNTFTHITCMNFTIYEFKEKLAFFRNCNTWMKRNGFLVIHLVDPLLFNAVVPVYKNKWQSKPDSARLVDTMVEFYDFDYHAHYSFPLDWEKTKIATFTETFTNNTTRQIRQNEQTLYMDSINDILKMANHAGFIFHGKVSMQKYNGDENQFLYILEAI